MNDAMPNTSIAPSADPISDAIIRPSEFVWGMKIMHTVTANTEPSDTPIIEGEARLFLVIPCIIAPDTARKAPISMAPITLGRRDTLTI
ncbi:hypothetical protein D3C77_701480 [compost metagenome]